MLATSPYAIDSHAKPRGRGIAALVMVLSFVLMMAACDKKKDKVATQAAARVNSQEITVHQINLALEQQRGLPPAQAASASRQVLARLVEQELALQEAQNQKVDRDPRVVRQIEAAKREIIARAYVDRISASVARPTSEDIKKYYDEHPALFTERRVYNLEELSIEAPAEQLDGIKAKLQGAKEPVAFLDTLKAQGIKVSARQGTTPAEQLPLDRLKGFARMKDGDWTFNQTPTGAQVMVLVSSRSLPVEEEKAKPAIEQFLLNERRQKAIRDDLAALRAAAKIEYVGEFAADPPPAPLPVPTGAAAPASGVMLENALKGLK